MGELIKEKIERNKEIYGLRKNGSKFREIGEIFSITPQRVRQIFLTYLPENVHQRELASLKRVTRFRKNISKILRIPYQDVLKIPESQTLSKITGKMHGRRDRFRELVRIRDKHTCQICFKVWQKGQRRFDVHHTEEEMEGRSHEKGAAKYDQNNTEKMITYCHKCHLNIDSVRNKMVIAYRKNEPSQSS